MKIVLVYRCTNCGSQRSTRTLKPHQPKHDKDPPIWDWVKGCGLVHGCSSRPSPEEIDGPRGRLPVFEFHSTELVALTGEDAEEWVLLESSSRTASEG